MLWYSRRDAGVSTAVHPHRLQTRLVFGGSSNETRRMTIIETRQHLHRDKPDRPEFWWLFFGMCSSLWALLWFTAVTPACAPSLTPHRYWACQSERVLTSNWGVEEMKTTMKCPFPVTGVFGVTALRPQVAELPGLFRTCWLTCQQECSYSCCACKQLIWNIIQSEYGACEHASHLLRLCVTRPATTDENFATNEVIKKDPASMGCCFCTQSPESPVAG